VVSGSTVRLARVAIGVAVKKDAPAPDIATIAAFEAALRQARSVAYVDPASGGSSSFYPAQLFAELGVADGVKAKAVLVARGSCSAVAALPAIVVRRMSRT